MRFDRDCSTCRMSASSKSFVIAANAIIIIIIVLIAITHLANVSVLHLLVFTSRPVEVLCALLLGDPVEDEVVRRTQIFLLDCLCKQE